jgi:hypothetical protein
MVGFLKYGDWHVRDDQEWETYPTAKRTNHKKAHPAHIDEEGTFAGNTAPLGLGL